ncbi:MAG: mannose-1-phosphate guanylyltransferase/mannose-6-phosphate isomerase, partial [Candidatus Competibacterales bacterium]
MILPVILSGGSGSRLWPLSRESYPKQFLPLTGADTMLQNTALRLQHLEEGQPPLVVCNDEHRFMVAEQLRAVGVRPRAVVLEPMGRNTAPAVAVAAWWTAARDEDPLLLVLPADHVIEDAAGFCRAVAQVAPLAQRGHLVTFGIVPRHPETGYGYIEAGLPVAEGILAVESFVEKPDAATARGYLAAGNYYWNSGMFLFKASRYLQELERLEPAMAEACRAALEGAVDDLDFTRLDAAAFATCPGNSIDYAVMEKTHHAVVIPVDVGWSDVGSWTALWEVGERDAAGNRIRGDVIAVDSKDSYLHAQHRLVAALGLVDCVVVESADAVLVAPKDRVQDVKGIVAQLAQAHRSEGRAHRKIYRPWGAYDAIESGERFQVKRITVNPGAALSLQMHHHRAEHWIVVRGTARVTRGDEVFLLEENQSTYIPLGTRHRLENPGKIPLELIEVQSGSYLGEDDIVRFEDVYGRTQDPRREAAKAPPPPSPVRPHPR